jgi:hypothetical protein
VHPSGSELSTGRDTCFVNIVWATPEPMSHLRMGGMHRCIMGGPQGNRMGQQFPGWVQYPETPVGREGFHVRPRVPGRGSTSLERNPLVTLPIGINAPFRPLPPVDLRSGSLRALFVESSEAQAAVG